MTTDAIIETLRRILCFIALLAYAICLYFSTLLLLSYAFHPLLDLHWPLLSSILLRWIPIVIFVRLWRGSAYVSRYRRSGAMALSVTSISLSYFLIAFAGHQLSRFVHDFLECTMDLWPAIVMILTVKSRSTRFQNSPGVATPIA
jgi:hypothetical protein